MRTDTSRHAAAAHEDARAEALRDSDSFANWLSIQCDRVKPLAWEPVWSEATLADAMPDFPARSVAGLLVLALDAGQKTATREAALDCLADRYCRMHAVAAQINDRALEISLEMVENERFQEAA